MKESLYFLPASMLEKATLTVLDNSLSWAELRQKVSSLFFIFMSLEPDQQRRAKAQRFRFALLCLCVSVVHGKRS